MSGCKVILSVKKKHEIITYTYFNSFLLCKNIANSFLFFGCMGPLHILIDILKDNHAHVLVVWYLGPFRFFFNVINPYKIFIVNLLAGTHYIDIGLCGACLGPVTLSTRPHHAENCKINLLNLKNILVLYNPNAPSRTQIQVDAHLNIKESSVKCILNPPQLIAEPTATSLNLKLNPPQLRPNLQS